MPATFDRLGISFQYPDNWTLDEEDALAGRESVTVRSPGGAFWSVSIHPRSADPAELARTALQTMKQEYQDLDAEQAHEELAGRQLVGFDMNFYCLDLTNTAEVRCVKADRATYTFFAQAEDREFDKVQLVFRAMATSLLSEPD